MGWHEEAALRTPKPVTGAGTAVKTIDRSAWVSAYSFTAGLTDATLVITLFNGTAFDTITARAGEAYNSPPLFDSGKLAGASFAFSDTQDFVIDTLVP